MKKISRRLFFHVSMLNPTLQHPFQLVCSFSSCFISLLPSLSRPPLTPNFFPLPSLSLLHPCNPQFVPFFVPSSSSSSPSSLLSLRSPTSSYPCFPVSPDSYFTLPFPRLFLSHVFFFHYYFSTTQFPLRLTFYSLNLIFVFLLSTFFYPLSPFCSFTIVSSFPYFPCSFATYFPIFLCFTINFLLFLFIQVSVFNFPVFLQYFLPLIHFSLHSFVIGLFFPYTFYRFISFLCLLFLLSLFSSHCVLSYINNFY